MMGEKTKESMGDATFTDLKGDKWTFPFTYASIARVKTEVGVDLLQAVPRSKESEDDQEEPLIVQLDFDVLLMVNVWYALLQPQLEKRSIDAVEFGEERVAVEIYSKVAGAFWRGYHDFFHKIGWSHVTKAINEQQKVMPTLRQRASETFARASELTLKSYDANAAKAIQEMEDEIVSTSGSTDSDLQAR